MPKSKTSTHSLFFRNLDLAIIDGRNDIRRMLSIHGATHRTSHQNHTEHSLAGSKDLLHGSSEFVSVGTLTQDLRHLNDLVESDVSVVLDFPLRPLPIPTVLLLLAVTRRLVQLTNDQRGSTGNHLHLRVKNKHETHGSLTIDHSQLDGDLQALPVHSGFLDIVSDFLRSLRDHFFKKEQIPYQEDRPWGQVRQEKHSLLRQHGDKLHSR